MGFVRIPMGFCSSGPVFHRGMFSASLRPAQQIAVYRFLCQVFEPEYTVVVFLDDFVILRN